MSSDVSLYDEELKTLEDEVAVCLRDMEALQGEARVAKYNRAQDLLKKINRTLHQFNYEVRVLEGDEQQAYEKKAQQHRQTINTLKEQVAQKRNAAASAAAAASAPPPKPGDARRDDARQMADRVGKTQDSTLKSLERTEQLVGDAEEHGTEAIGTLKKQTEQIKEVNVELDVLDSQVNRAKKELNAFIRRMATDKIIICFALLVIIGIIVIVVLRLKNGPSDGGSMAPPAPTTLPPPPPTTILTTTTAATTTSGTTTTTTTTAAPTSLSSWWRALK